MTHNTTIMTRAEAICAANNILELAEELNNKFSESGRFPNDYYIKITDQAQSMKEHITNNIQYRYVTPKMASWFRCTWRGLCNWDHDNEFNDDIFYGLNDVIEKLESKVVSPASSTSSTTHRAQKGRESTDNTLCTPSVSSTTDTTHAVTVDEPSHCTCAKTHKENITRLRDERLGIVLRQVTVKNIRLIDSSVIRRADLEYLLNLTKSDRTQQLISAAFLAGKVAGIRDIVSELTKE